MFTIGQLSRRALVRADALRLYERQGLLAAPAKTSSGYRLYDEDALRWVAFIKHSQVCGFSLAEIRELLQEPPCDSGALNRTLRLLREKTQVETTVVALQAMSQALSELMSELEREGSTEFRTSGSSLLQAYAGGAA